MKKQLGPSWSQTVLFLFFGASLLLISNAAPVQDSTDLEQYPGTCYYNYNHYNEGDRILTNEPCLNCTCHNQMLMCYLRVCPFTKPIGHDCVVEKREDQCCPIITCPDVPVELVDHKATETEIGFAEKYGCYIEEKFYPEGAQVPSNPNKPCELCYCIRNRTSCLMQECTLHVDGCQPIYNRGVCCPVRYECEHDLVGGPFLEDSHTTVRPTEGFILTTVPSIKESSSCTYNDFTFADGALIPDTKPCEHCYCMKGDIVCAVQECAIPLEHLEHTGKNCTYLPPPAGECCPQSYICQDDESVHSISEDVSLQVDVSLMTTVAPFDSEAESVTDEADSHHHKLHETVSEEDVQLQEHIDDIPKTSTLKSTEAESDSGLDATTIAPASVHIKLVGENEEVDEPETTTQFAEIDSHAEDVGQVAHAGESTELSSADSITTELPHKAEEVATAISDDKLSSTESILVHKDALAEEQQEQIATTDSSEIVYNIPSEFIPMAIPGEGDCLYNNVTYRNNSLVPRITACDEDCMCLSSIIKCKKIECVAAVGPHCRIIESNDPNVCCPVYSCDGEVVKKDDRGEDDANLGTTLSSLSQSEGTTMKVDLIEKISDEIKPDGEELQKPEEPKPEHQSPAQAASENKLPEQPLPDEKLPQQPILEHKLPEKVLPEEELSAATTVTPIDLIPVEASPDDLAIHEEGSGLPSVESSTDDHKQQLGEGQESVAHLPEEHKVEEHPHIVEEHVQEAQPAAENLPEPAATEVSHAELPESQTETVEIKDHVEVDVSESIQKPASENEISKPIELAPSEEKKPEIAEPMDAVPHESETAIPHHPEAATELPHLLEASTIGQEVEKEGEHEFSGTTEIIAEQELEHHEPSGDEIASQGAVDVDRTVIQPEEVLAITEQSTGVAIESDSLITTSSPIQIIAEHEVVEESEEKTQSPVASTGLSAEAEHSVESIEEIKPHQELVDSEMPHPVKVEDETSHPVEVEGEKPHSVEVEGEMPHSVEVEGEMPHPEVFDSEKVHSAEVENGVSSPEAIDSEMPHPEIIESDKPHSESEQTETSSEESTNIDKEMTTDELMSAVLDILKATEFPVEEHTQEPGVSGEHPVEEHTVSHVDQPQEEQITERVDIVSPVGDHTEAHVVEATDERVEDLPVAHDESHPTAHVPAAVDSHAHLPEAEHEKPLVESAQESAVDHKQPASELKPEEIQTIEHLPEKEHPIELTTITSIKDESHMEEASKPTEVSISEEHMPESVAPIEDKDHLFSMIVDSLEGKTTVQPDIIKEESVTEALPGKDESIIPTTASPLSETIHDEHPKLPVSHEDLPTKHTEIVGTIEHEAASEATHTPEPEEHPAVTMAEAVTKQPEVIEHHEVEHPEEGLEHVEEAVTSKPAEEKLPGATVVKDDQNATELPEKLPEIPVEQEVPAVKPHDVVEVAAETTTSPILEEVMVTDRFEVPVSSEKPISEDSHVPHIEETVTNLGEEVKLPEELTTSMPDVEEVKKDEIPEVVEIATVSSVAEQESPTSVAIGIEVDDHVKGELPSVPEQPESAEKPESEPDKLGEGSEPSVIAEEAVTTAQPIAEKIDVESLVTPQAEHEAEIKPDVVEAEAKPVEEMEAEHVEEAKPEQEVEMKPELVAEAKPEQEVPQLETEMKPDHEGELIPGHGVDVTPEHELETSPEHVIDLKPEHEVEMKPEHEHEMKPEHELEIKPEHELDIKPEHELEIKPEHELEIKPEHELEIKPEHELEMKPEHEEEKTSTVKTEIGDVHPTESSPSIGEEDTDKIQIAEIVTEGSVPQSGEMAEPKPEKDEIADHIPHEELITEHSATEPSPVTHHPHTAKPIDSLDHEIEPTANLPTGQIGTTGGASQTDSDYGPMPGGHYSTFNQEEEYTDEEDPSTFGPGTCRYGGKLFVSAQQIPRDDPCDFCFCFRSDIICLQQSCPPPISGCHEEPIQGFCCPRYECPVLMGGVLNMTTTTTTTTTLPPHMAHHTSDVVTRTGCYIGGQSFKVGDAIESASGPCISCSCGGDGQMKCEPKVCTPEPMLRQMIAVVSSRRR